MPFLIALVVLFVGLLIWSRMRGPGGRVSFGRNPCKWEKTGDTNGRFVEYRCASCQVASYSTTGKPPVTCKRNLKGKT